MFIVNIKWPINNKNTYREPVKQNKQQKETFDTIVNVEI